VEVAKMELAYSAVVRTGRSLGEAFERARHVGAQRLDLWISGAAKYGEPSWERMTRSLQSAVEQFGLPIAALGAPLGGSVCVGAADIRADRWRRFRRLLDAADAVGAPLVRVRAGAVPPGLPFTEALDLSHRLLGPMVEAAGERGISLTLEPLAGSPFRTPEGFLALAEVCPGLGLTYDPASFIIQRTPLLITETLFSHVALVRLHDALSGRGPAPWGCGHLDAAWLMDRLLYHGYAGAVAVEQFRMREDAGPCDEIARIFRELDGLVRRFSVI
jgi:sugar phosphate isomerase/epimerase